jgi:hypothetical protein
LLTKAQAGKLPMLLQCATVIFCSSVLADEQDSLPIPVTAPVYELLNSIDAPRDYFSEKLVGFASDIDRFFGDDRNYQESNTSVFQIDITKVRGYGGTPKPVISGRAKLNLPSAEKRMHLTFETNPDKNLTGDSPQGQSVFLSQVTAPISYALAARFEKYFDNHWNFSTDTGIKFQGGITPFARARGGYSVSLGQWRLNTAESVYWFNTTGVGETTQLDIERFISNPILFRASSNATWSKNKQNFDLRQDFSIFHTLNERAALLYQASVIGVSNPKLQVSDYVVQMLYRYRLHRKWVYFELSPQFHFPRENSYRYSPALSLRLEMLFDEAK